MDKSILFGDDVEQIKLYLENHPKGYEAVNDFGMNPIEYASFYGRCDVVSYFLTTKMNVGISLSIACISGSVDIIQILLDNGIRPNTYTLRNICYSPNSIDIFNRMLPYISSFEGMMKIAIETNKKDLVEALIPFTNLQEKNYIEQIVTNWQTNGLNICKLLVKAGATIPLDILHDCANKESIDYFLSLGCDPTFLSGGKTVVESYLDNILPLGPIEEEDQQVIEMLTTE